MKRHTIYLLVIFLAALLLRLAFLGEKSVWLDEAYSVWSAERTVEQIWTTTTDNHPPLYYLLQTPGYLLSGGSLTAMRLLSLLLGAGVIILAYAIVLRLAPQEHWLALTTAVIVAVPSLPAGIFAL